MRNGKKKQKLYEKYCERLQTEYKFNNLKANYDSIYEFVRRNPQYGAYYANWMQRVERLMREYGDTLDKPEDQVSFSTVYGFAKDEDVRTVYRHPRFQTEINVSKMARYQKLVNSQYKPVSYFVYNPYAYAAQAFYR